MDNDKNGISIDRKIAIFFGILTAIGLGIAIYQVILDLFYEPRAGLSIFEKIDEKGSSIFAQIPDEIDTINIICCIESDTIDRYYKATKNFIGLPFEISSDVNKKAVHVSYSIEPTSNKHKRNSLVLNDSVLDDCSFLDSFKDGLILAPPAIDDDIVIKPKIPTISQKRMLVSNIGNLTNDTINEYQLEIYISQQEGKYPARYYTIKCTFVVLDTDLSYKGHNYFLFYANSLIGSNVKENTILCKYRISDRVIYDKDNLNNYCIFQDCYQSYSPFKMSTRIEIFYHPRFFLVIFLVLVFAYLLYNFLKRYLRYHSLFYTNRQLNTSHRSKIFTLFFKKETISIAIIILILLAIKTVAVKLFHIYFIQIPV
jgi:hypothetical protein